MFFFFFFFFNDTATTEIYTLSLHDALPIRLQDARDVRIGEPGDHRRDVHAHAQSGGGQSLDGLDPPLRGRDVGLDGVGMLAVPERHAHADGHARGPLDLLEQVEVALDQRRLGDDPHRVAVLGADLETSARQPVARLPTNGARTPRGGAWAPRA